MNPYLTRKEVAERFNVSTSTIDRLANDGKLKRVGHGKFRRCDIEEYEQKASGQTETFAERRLKQRIRQLEDEVALYKQKILRITEMANSYSQEIIKERIG